jgi:hypothetical protein
VKVHLLSSAEPIREGIDHMAACTGSSLPVIVRDAIFAFQWEGDIAGVLNLSLPTICRECAKEL